MTSFTFNTEPSIIREPGCAGRRGTAMHAMEAHTSRLGLQTHLREASVGEAHVLKLTPDAMIEQRLLVNNPRVVSQADVRAIHGAAW